MKTIHMLFGFDAQKTSDRICMEIMNSGHKVISAKRLTKPAIFDYVQKNPSCTTLVLKEFLDDGSCYTAEELARLNDLSDHNIVVILQEKRRGTDYVQMLYQAGITSAVFSNERKGVVPELVAELVCNKRCRKKAREFYGIKENVFDTGSLTYSDYADFYRYLCDESQGINEMDRFLIIMGYLSPRKAADFIKKLPTQTLDIFSHYSEFYDVLDELRKLGIYTFPYKRPKNVKKGLDARSFSDRALGELGELNESVSEVTVTATGMTKGKEVPEEKISTPPLLSSKKSFGFLNNRKKKQPVTFEQEIFGLMDETAETVAEDLRMDGIMDEPPEVLAAERAADSTNVSLVAPEESLKDCNDFSKQNTFTDISSLESLMKNISAEKFLEFLKQQGNSSDTVNVGQDIAEPVPESDSEETVSTLSDDTSKNKEGKRRTINITEEMRKVINPRLHVGVSDSDSSEESPDDDDAFQLFQRFKV